MTTPDLDAVVLPPLPEWMLDDGITTLADFELRDHMGSYATAAVLADRERRAPAAPVVAGTLRKALADLLTANAHNASCQAGIASNCICVACATERARAALSAPVGAAAPVVAGPVGWIDQFGNLFHLGAWVPSRATYHDSYKTPWQPVYRAAPVGAAPDVPSPPPLFASSVARRKWESLQADGYRMQSITFEREGRRGWIDPWGKVMWAQVASTIDAAAGT